MGRCHSKNAIREEEAEEDLEDELDEAEGFRQNFVAAAGSAFFKSIEREESEVIRERWSLNNVVMEEYKGAHAKFCLLPCWRAHTRLLRYIRATAKELKADRANEQRLCDLHTFQKLLAQVYMGLCIEKSVRRRIHRPHEADWNHTRCH